MTVVNDHSGAGWQKMLYRAFIELQSKTASFPPDLKKRKQPLSIFRVALEDSDSDQYCISNNLNKKKRTGYQRFCMRSHIIELCRENEHVKARRSKNEYKAAELKCQHHLREAFKNYLADFFR